MQQIKSTNVQEIIARHRAITTPVWHRYNGRKFIIFPHVFSPFLAPSGILGLSLSLKPIFEGKRVLDVGCGAGILPTIAASAGAEGVVGVDINPHAIKNATRNAQINAIENKVEFRIGDVFQPLRSGERFDIVFADLPFTTGLAIDMLDRAFFDPDFSTIRQFIHGLPNILNDPNSRAYFCLSDLEFVPYMSFDNEKDLIFEPYLNITLPWLMLSIIQIRLAN